MEEETVNCPSCDREVPKTLYCIYCGAALFNVEATEVSETETVEEETEEDVEEFEEESEEEAEDVSTEESVEDVPGVEVEPGIQTLMKDLQNNIFWKIKLVGLLCTGDVSEAVFTKLFDEYQSKINSLTQLRNEKMEHFRDGLDKKKEEYKEAKLKLEELRVRCAVGEIDKTDLESRAPELEKKVESLATETTYVDAQLDRLNNLLGGTTPKEIMEIEKTASQCNESLTTLVDTGTIGETMAETLSNDLEAVLKIFDSIIGERKREEEKLLEKLSTLETRYKIGEISISDFEQSKRETQIKLQKIWE